MGQLIGLPTLDLGYIKPARMTWRKKGGATEGGKNGEGDSVSTETSGGGILAGSYENCFIHDREAHEYALMLGARLDGSYRYINVPILNDWPGAFPVNDLGIPQPFITGIPHSDGSLFSDTSGYSQETVFGVVAADAGPFGLIRITIIGAARAPRWSEWFSLEHSIKGHRAYRTWQHTLVGEAEPVTVDGQAYVGDTYEFSIDRPLRQAVTAGMRVTFTKPLCVMKFPADFILPWDVEGWWISRPTLMFEEAMA